MADLIIYILISTACALGLIGLIVQIIIHKKKRLEVDIYKEQMQYAVDQTTREMQKFFDYLQLKPTTKGGFGENIVDMLLSNLPKKFVKKQYSPNDISGSRIDFAVQLPNSNLLIPIDCKFITPKYIEENPDFHLDKISVDRLNKEIIRRAKEIAKYVKSAETTDFVLIFIPDIIFSVIESSTFQELAIMNIIPTNSSGLLSTIFMINMQHRFMTLNSAANRFGYIQMNICQGLREVVEKMRIGTTQLQNSLNNFSDAMTDVIELNTLLETLGEANND
ncbi:MAG: DNA recombination protein RmuC [Asgard group archaeon]|nr:DNA recombination protein RmuC [Asgard group archaeon]